MADLNFNALARPGPRSFYQGFEQGQENRVTSEINQMKLDELRRDRDEMLQLREQLKGLGQDPDPTKYLDALARTGNPKYVQMAIEGKQKIRDLEAYAKLGVIEPVPAVSGMPTSTPGAIAAPSVPAPRTERGVDIYGKPVEVEVGGGIASPGAMGQPLAPFDAPAPPTASPGEPYLGYNASIGMAPPSANALAPSAPAPTGTNALAAQPNAAQAAATQKRIEQLLGFARTNPRFANQAMAEARLLQDQLELYSKRGPAPAAPSEIGKLEAEIATLVQNGAEPNDPRIVARRGKISQLSGAGAPLDITRAMAERDRLIASGRSQTDPDVAALNAYIRKQTTPTPGASVTVKLPPLESAEQKGQGELNIKNVDEIRAAAKLAQKTLPAIETQARILDQGFTTGFGTEFKKAGASVLAALGVQNAEKFATNAQTFIAATQQAVLQKQLEQKGTQTAADADRITQTGAQLGNTVNGNRFIIDVAKAQLKRDIDQRDFYAKWWSTKKTYEGAEDAWYAGEGGKSLFDRPELKKYVAPTAAETNQRQQGLANIFGGKK